jgi:hypothetical protein
MPDYSVTSGTALTLLTATDIFRVASSLAFSETKKEPTQGAEHKVRTYKEYHSVCPSSELGLSQLLSRQCVFPSPQKRRGGGTLSCGWGVGGSPNSDEGHTLWYSLYVRTLWGRAKNGTLVCLQQASAL